MTLPSLVNLSLSDTKRPKPKLSHLSAHFRWINSCGGWFNLPHYKSWQSVKGDMKAEFYNLINLSENDKFSGGQYYCPYSGIDIDELMNHKRYSIEHVVPRSLINGGGPGRGEDDLFGWEFETRRMNATRSNLPLVLWPTPGLPVGRVEIDGDVTHFNPMEIHKARLARRWLYIRAVYGLHEDLESPSESQKKHADEIIAVVKTQYVGYAEKRMAVLTAQYVTRKYNVIWENALYNNDIDKANKFLNDDDWIRFVFQLD